MIDIWTIHRRYRTAPHSFCCFLSVHPMRQLKSIPVTRTVLDQRNCHRTDSVCSEALDSAVEVQLKLHRLPELLCSPDHLTPLGHTSMV